MTLGSFDDYLCPNCGTPYDNGDFACDGCDTELPKPNERERIEHEREEGSGSGSGVYGRNAVKGQTTC